MNLRRVTSKHTGQITVCFRNMNNIPCNQTWHRFDFPIEKPPFTDDFPMNLWEIRKGQRRPKEAFKGSTNIFEIQHMKRWSPEAIVEAPRRQVLLQGQSWRLEIEMIWIKLNKGWIPCGLYSCSFYCTVHYEQTTTLFTSPLRKTRVFVNGDLNHGDLRSIGVIAFIATWEEANLVMEN